MELKGKVTQIVPKESFRNIFGMGDFKCNFVVLIFKEDFPSNYFEGVWYKIKNRKKDYAWSVKLNEVNFSVGDIVELDVDVITEPTTLQGSILYEAKNLHDLQRK